MDLIAPWRECTMGFTLRTTRITRPVLAAAATVLLATSLTACGGEDDGGEDDAAKAEDVGTQFLTATKDKDARGVCELTAIDNDPLKENPTLLDTCVEGMELTFQEMKPEDVKAMEERLAQDPVVEETGDKASVKYGAYSVELTKIEDDWYIVA